MWIINADWEFFLNISNCFEHFWMFCIKIYNEDFLCCFVDTPLMITTYLHLFLPYIMDMKNLSQER